MNPMDLTGKTIVVTGAAQGIGKATVELIVQLGGNAVAVDLNGDGMRDGLAHVDQDRIMIAPCSVVDAEFSRQTVAKGVERFGSIEGLVNNAGIVRAALLEKMTLDQWNEVIAVHLTGSFIWTQAVGLHMIERARAGSTNPGSIVNISSDAGRRGSFGQVNYAAAKSGMFGLTMTAAKEWGKHRIRSNSVCFGVVETPMTETIRGEKFRDRTLAGITLGYYASPNEVVKSVCFLLSDAASYITGQQFSVNGGNHISV